MKLASPFLCCVWLALVVKATDEVAENCTRGPFNFDNDDTWNTTNTGWERKKCRIWFAGDQCMTASFPEEPDNDSEASSYFLESPTLCSEDNATYQLSFSYYVSGWRFWRTSCFLAVHLWSEDTRRQLWRSSGPTFYLFWKPHPPLRFRPCSSHFKLIFEGTNQQEGDCGSDRVSFDNVKYTLVRRRSRSALNGTCDWIPDDEPADDDDDNFMGMSMWAVIAIIVSLAVVTMILTALLLAAVVCGRKRKKQRINDKKSTSTSSGYQTFGHYMPQQARQSRCMSDYENMEVSDRLMTTQLLPSGGSDPYNRLHATGGATSMEEDNPHAHYDHFEGSTAYHDLHQQDRTRELQRESMAPNYSHI